MSIVRRCKARSKRSGAPCKSPPVTGRKVCRMHGGATPRGIASPHFRHGLYSKFARADLADRISDLRQDESRLHDLREVLAVQGALLAEALAQDNLAAATAISEAVSRSIDRYKKHPEPPKELLTPEQARERMQNVEIKISRILGQGDERRGVRHRIAALVRRIAELEPGKTIDDLMADMKKDKYL